MVLMLTVVFPISQSKMVQCGISQEQEFLYAQLSGNEIDLEACKEAIQIFAILIVFAGNRSQ